MKLKFISLMILVFSLTLLMGSASALAQEAPEDVPDPVPVEEPTGDEPAVDDEDDEPVDDEEVQDHDPGWSCDSRTDYPHLSKHAGYQRINVIG